MATVPAAAAAAVVAAAGAEAAGVASAVTGAAFGAGLAGALSPSVLRSRTGMRLLFASTSSEGLRVSSDGRCFGGDAFLASV